MNTFHNPRLTGYSKTLRKNMTKEERHLWYDFLKTLSVPVHRQKVIGQYIVDFYCASAKLVIELDGSQHYEESGQVKDRERDDFFKQQGITVLRYSNLDINRYFERVCEDILLHISAKTGSLPLEADSPDRGNVREADKRVAVSGEEKVPRRGG